MNIGSILGITLFAITSPILAANSDNTSTQVNSTNSNSSSANPTDMGTINTTGSTPADTTSPRVRDSTSGTNTTTGTDSTIGTNKATGNNSTTDADTSEGINTSTDISTSVNQNATTTAVSPNTNLNVDASTNKVNITGITTAPTFNSVELRDGTYYLPESITPVNGFYFLTIGTTERICSIQKIKKVKVLKTPHKTVVMIGQKKTHLYCYDRTYFNF